MFQEAASENNVESWARALSNLWELSKEFDQKHALICQEAAQRFPDAKEVAKNQLACSDCLRLQEEALRSFKSIKCPDMRLKAVHEAARDYLEVILDLNKAASKYQQAALAFAKADSKIERLADVRKANEKIQAFSLRIGGAKVLFGATLFVLKELHVDLFCDIAPKLQAFNGFTCVLPNGKRIIFPFD